MAAWWQSLTALEHVLLYIAVPATLVLVIQTILLFAGGVFLAEFRCFCKSVDCGLYILHTAGSLTKAEISDCIIGVDLYYFLIVLHCGCIVFLVEKEIALLHVQLGDEGFSFDGYVILSVFVGFCNGLVEDDYRRVYVIGGCQFLADGVEQGGNVPLAVEEELLSLRSYDLGLAEGFFKIFECSGFVARVKSGGTLVVEGCR